MKKVFFTAIAMIAFSSASMANTIADEEVVITNEVKEEVAVKADCKAFAIHMTNACETIADECFTPTEYDQAITYWTGWCMALTAF